MKFYGLIGFWEGNEEISPGIYEDKIIEKPYSGTVNWHNRHFVDNGNQNEDLKMNNQISILADLYFQKNFSSIRYVIWGGAKWKVTNVDIGYPRVVLTIGGVYNGPGGETAEIT